MTRSQQKDGEAKQRRERDGTGATVVVHFKPKAMGCISCANTVRGVFDSMDGIVTDDVSVEKATATLYVKDKFDGVKLVTEAAQKVTAAGFPTEIISFENDNAPAEDKHVNGKSAKEQDKASTPKASASPVMLTLLFLPSFSCLFARLATVPLCRTAGQQLLPPPARREPPGDVEHRSHWMHGDEQDSLPLQDTDQVPDYHLAILAVGPGAETGLEPLAPDALLVGVCRYVL